MKIIAIHIKNLASLEGETRIDFTVSPLRTAGIFAITGATGSGKSTILDALCLALYAKTPRYNQGKESGVDIVDVQGNSINQGDVRGILRDGTGDGFAKVEFVGIDEDTYRASWFVRRARDKADGSLQQDSMKLENLSTNLVIAAKKVEVLAEIEKRVGLQYEQFTRSVLLAQGDFTAFLKAPKDAKANLLEKLTGTTHYAEISKKVFEHCRSEQQQLRDLQIRQQELHVLTSEELQILTDKKAVLHHDVHVLEELKGQLQGILKWYAEGHRLRKLFEEASALRAAEQEKVNQHEHRSQLLKQIKQVQTIRSLVESLRDDRQKQEDLKVAFNRTHADKVSLQDQLEDSKYKLQQAQLTVIAKQNEWNAALPLLDEAKVIDVKLLEREAQVKQARHAWNGIVTEFEAHQQRIQKMQTEKDAFGNELTSIDAWLENNQSRKLPAENQVLITTKLDDASVILHEQQQQQKLIAQYESDIQVTGNKIAEAEKNLQASKLALEKLENDLQHLQTKQSVLHADEFTNQLVQTDQQRLIFTEAKQIWIQYQTAKQSQADIQTSLHEYQDQLMKQQDSLKTCSARLHDYNIQKQNTAQLLQQAQRAASLTADELRASLHDGQPCPVCGSTSHPYATLDPKLQHVLSELEQTYLQQVSEYEECLSNHSRLEQACLYLADQIKQLESAFRTAQKQADESHKIWSSNAYATSIGHLAEEDVLQTIDVELNLVSSKHQDINDQFKAWSVQQNLIDDLKKQKEEGQQALHLQTQAYLDIGRTLQSLQEKIEECSAQSEKATSGLSAIEKQLSVYFSNSSWFEKWKSDPDQFTMQLVDFSISWQNQQARKTDIEQALQQCVTAFDRLQQQQENVTKAKLEKETLLAELTNDFDTLQKSRQTYFNGVAASVVEQQLKDACRAAEDHCANLVNHCHALENDMTKADTLLAQMEKDQEQRTVRIRETQQKYESWLFQYNETHQAHLDENDVEKLLHYDQAWIESEEQALSALQLAYSNAVSICTDRQLNLAKHVESKVSELEEAEGNRQCQATEQEIEEKKKAINHIDFELQGDQQKRTMANQLLQQIDAQAAIVLQWSKLNELIGSADGKKFKLIAQAYTLDVLLGFANKHLVQLSKRYVLQRIPDTLGLLVIDQDMGDEQRGVYSLSGGESFLISLALALGLASLSANRVKVESLFIDEGFGSLDPETLNIAMDALESLHHQGRKVGVISHVQEMTERIPVQIQVSKQNNGKSKVRIFG